MNGQRLTDAQIAAALRAHVPERAPAALLNGVLNAVDTTPQQRPAPPLLSRLMDADPTARRRSLLIAAALLVGLAIASAAGVGALRLQQHDPIPGLDSAPLDVTWSPSRAAGDWPGPVRHEPVDGGSVVFRARGADEPVLYADPEGDVIPNPFHPVDIVDVAIREGCWMSMTIEACVFFDLAATPPPGLHPQSAWVAYGIVVDNTGDGQPDLRFGVDNAAAPTAPSYARMWSTDLATTSTRAPTMLEDGVMDAVFPNRTERRMRPKPGTSSFAALVLVSASMSGPR